MAGRARSSAAGPYAPSGLGWLRKDWPRRFDRRYGLGQQASLDVLDYPIDGPESVLLNLVLMTVYFVSISTQNGISNGVSGGVQMVPEQILAFVPSISNPCYEDRT